MALVADDGAAPAALVNAKNASDDGGEGLESAKRGKEGLMRLGRDRGLDGPGANHVHPAQHSKSSFLSHRS